MRTPSISQGSKVRGMGTTGLRNRGTRNLPYLEYVTRREEGRCFHYGGAYNPGHRCPEQNLGDIILAIDKEYGK